MTNKTYGATTGGYFVARQTSKKPSLQDLVCVVLSTLCSIYKTPIVSRKSGCPITAMVIRIHARFVVQE